MCDPATPTSRPMGMKEKVPTDKVLISGTISHCSVTPHCSERCDYDRGVHTTLATRQYQAKQGLALHLPPCPDSLGCFQLQLVSEEMS